MFSKVPVGFGGWKVLDALISLQVPFHINSLSVAVHCEFNIVIEITFDVLS